MGVRVTAWRCNYGGNGSGAKQYCFIGLGVDHALEFQEETANHRLLRTEYRRRAVTLAEITSHSPRKAV